MRNHHHRPHWTPPLSPTPPPLVELRRSFWRTNRSRVGTSISFPFLRDWCRLFSFFSREFPEVGALNSLTWVEDDELSILELCRLESSVERHSPPQNLPTPVIKGPLRIAESVLVRPMIFRKLQRSFSSNQGFLCYQVCRIGKNTWVPPVIRRSSHTVRLPRKGRDRTVLLHTVILAPANELALRGYPEVAPSGRFCQE